MKRTAARAGSSRRALARLASVLAAAAAAATAIGCAADGKVARVVDGRVIEGAYVQPEAYAAFLRGAIAEEQGDLTAALAAYQEASGIDPADPEVWTRIAAVRCRRSPKDAEIRWSLARALVLDADYAPAWEVRARCELARGEDRVTVERDALRAADTAPDDVPAQVLLARVEGTRPRSSSAGRERLLALTLTHGRSGAAWDALGAWSRGHGEARLAAEAYAEVARLAPMRRGDVAAIALELAGEGELDAARALAGALVDAGRSSGRSNGVQAAPAADPLIARLAIDFAVVLGDRARVASRATAAHLGIDVAAGRALLLGEPAMAKDLVEARVRADPGDVGARLVLASAAHALGDGAALGRALDGVGAVDAGLDPAVVLPFVATLARATSPGDARRVAEAAARPILRGDAVAVEAAIDLVARGVLADAVLPPDGRVELAARSGAAIPPALDGLDARHRLLVLAMTRPASLEARALARRLSTGRDPLVAVGLARMALAGGAPIDPAVVARLVALAPADPLVAGAALDLAKRRGDEGTVRTLRARLSALVLLPSERARYAE